MKKHIPNFLTCCNLMVGAVGIVWVMTESATSALSFVLVAAVFDFLDGLAARALKVQSEIGKQLDSLADLVSFGVLPAIGLYIALRDQIRLDIEFPSIAGLDPIALVAFIPLVIIPFSALRLAKFNVSLDQSDEFKGLPTPANAIMMSAFLLWDPNLFKTGIILLITVGSCHLLVSNIRMIAFKFKSMAWKGNELRYLLLALLVGGFVIFQLSFVPFVIPTYIVFSIIGNYYLKPVLFK